MVVVAYSNKKVDGTNRAKVTVAQLYRELSEIPDSTLFKRTFVF